jgi:hypothetical protein
MGAGDRSGPDHPDSQLAQGAVAAHDPLAARGAAVIAVGALPRPGSLPVSILV